MQIYFDDEDGSEVVIVINKQNDGTYSFGFAEAIEGIMDEVNDQILDDRNVITLVIAFDDDGDVIYNYEFENNVNDFGKNGTNSRKN